MKTCPSSYYHYLNGTRGACVLSPSPDATFNPNRPNVLFNASNKEFDYNWEDKRGCPSGSTYYAYGCYCVSSNSFFDRSKGICALSN